MKNNVQEDNVRVEVRHMQCKSEADGFRLKKQINKLGWFCSCPFLNYVTNQWCVTTNII